MKFTEAGVARALRVYSVMAQSIGVDGAKHDRPIGEDRVFRRWVSLSEKEKSCRCSELSRELARIKDIEQEERANLLAIAVILRRASLARGHIVEDVRRIVDAVKKDA